MSCIWFASRDKDRWILEYTNCCYALLEMKVEHFKLQLALQLMFICNGKTPECASEKVSINGLCRECLKQKKGNVNVSELMDFINEKLSSVLDRI